VADSTPFVMLSKQWLTSSDVRTSLDIDHTAVQLTGDVHFLIFTYLLVSGRFEFTLPVHELRYPCHSCWHQLLYCRNCSTRLDHSSSVFCFFLDTGQSVFISTFTLSPVDSNSWYHWMVDKKHQLSLITNAIHLASTWFSLLISMWPIVVSTYQWC